MKLRLLNLLIALDQFIYVMVTLGAGSPDETLSAAAYRTEQNNKVFGKLFRPVIDFLFRLFETEHCKKAFVAEQRRAHLPREYSRQFK